MTATLLAGQAFSQLQRIETQLDAPQASRLFDVFPGDVKGVEPPEGKTTFTDTFTPSGSTWHPAGREENVFLQEVAHRGSPETDWSVRVGRGGMIYSLRGPFGESVPPQRAKSLWNDEVWQLVAVNLERLLPAQIAGRTDRALRDELRSLFYFAHQSGTYNRDPDFDGTFYSPRLAEQIDSQDRSYSVLNWIQMAHVPSVWKSHLYCYTRVRDMGSGVIELTYVLWNGGDVTLDHINAPWGGVRHSALPDILVSRRSGDWSVRDALFNSGDASAEVPHTAGWSGWSSDASDAASPSLLVVFGNQGKGAASLGSLAGAAVVSPSKQKVGVWRWGKALHNPPGRDYSVGTAVFKPTVEPGQTVMFRTFFVIGPRDQAIARAAQLAPQAGSGLVVFDAQACPATEVGVTATGKTVRAFARPVADARPLLLLRETDTNRLIVTCDPYLRVPSRPLGNPMPQGAAGRDMYDGLSVHRPYLSTVEHLALLGYGVAATGLDENGGGLTRPTEPMPASFETPWGVAEVAPDAAGLHVPLNP